jgi:hypothetical protein
LTFDEDGTAFGDHGVATTAPATGSLDGHDITIGPVATPCGSAPPRAASWTRRPPSTPGLEAAVGIQIAPHLLTLVDEDGRTLVEAVK